MSQASEEEDLETDSSPLRDTVDNGFEFCLCHCQTEYCFFPMVSKSPPFCVELSRGKTTSGWCGSGASPAWFPSRSQHPSLLVQTPGPVSKGYFLLSPFQSLLKLSLESWNQIREATGKQPYPGAIQTDRQTNENLLDTCPGQPQLCVCVCNN